MENKSIRNTTLDILTSLGIYAVLGAFVAQLSRVPKEVVGYPKFLIIGSFIFNTILLVQNLYKHRKETDTDSVNAADFKRMIPKVITYIVTIFAYILLIPRLGYLLTTFLFILGMLIYIGVRSKKQLVLLPVLMTLGIYLLFNYVLKVLLPTGSWISALF